MANNIHPKVSIGIPIYHGEIYLEETLKCLLKQTYRDFEIIITDNNPGGSPEQIALEYSGKYDFIEYIQHDKNIGAISNWNSIIPKAKGEYFVYAGGHDLLSDDFLEKTVSVLDQNPEVVLAYAPTKLITIDGLPINKGIGLLDTCGSGVIQRCNQVLWGNQEPLYGLIRLEAIRRTRLQKEIVGSGAVWLLELAIQGEFQSCYEITRFRRANRELQDRETQLTRYHKSLFNRKRVRILPHWRIPWHCFLSCFRGQLGFMKRLRLFITIGTTALLRYLPDMFSDIISLFYRIPRGRFY
jgi:glycosyltransferase involved in cell wall biosynthesis